jgi:hypothetical protein
LAFCGCRRGREVSCGYLQISGDIRGSDDGSLKGAFDFADEKGGEPSVIFDSCGNTGSVLFPRDFGAASDFAFGFGDEAFHFLFFFSEVAAAVTPGLGFIAREEFIGEYGQDAEDKQLEECAEHKRVSLGWNPLGE